MSRERKWLLQSFMVSQCQNPDGDLALQSYYRDNINKAGDLTQSTVQSKHSGNMNLPFSFPPTSPVGLYQDSTSTQPHLQGKYQWVQGHSGLYLNTDQIPQRTLISFPFKRELLFPLSDQFNSIRQICTSPNNGPGSVLRVGVHAQVGKMQLENTPPWRFQSREERVVTCPSPEDGNVRWQALSWREALR